MFAKTLVLTGGLAGGALAMHHHSSLGPKRVHAVGKDDKESKFSPFSAVNEAVGSVKDSYRSGVRNVNDGLDKILAAQRRAIQFKDDSLAFFARTRASAHQVADDCQRQPEYLAIPGAGLASYLLTYRSGFFKRWTLVALSTSIVYSVIDPQSASDIVRYHILYQPAPPSYPTPPPERFPTRVYNVVQRTGSWLLPEPVSVDSVEFAKLEAQTRQKPAKTETEAKSSVDEDPPHNDVSAKHGQVSIRSGDAAIDLTLPPPTAPEKTTTTIQITASRTSE